MKFGSAVREECFDIAQDVTPINHGSWGATPRKVTQARIRALKETDAHVDINFRYTYKSQWFSSLQTVCNFLGIDVKNTAFVENTTLGINTILKSLELQPADAILEHKFTYKAIRYTCHSVIQRSGCKLLRWDVGYEINSKRDVIASFENTLKQHPNIKLAVIDHISSGTATLFPVDELCALCRKYDVISVIDGAHAPGQLKLDLEKTDPDFFVGNLHKWVFGPRSTAVLWMNPKHHSSIRPLLTSHCFASKNFQDEFYVRGTVDYSAEIAAEAAIEFYQSLGGFDAVHEYNSSLVSEAAAYLVDLWKTETLPIPPEMQAPYMRLVRLPELKDFQAQLAPEKNQGDCLSLLEYFIKERKFNVNFCDMRAADGKVNSWVRLSAQVYNTMDDFHKLGREILQLAK